jgi:hypothetical protein
MHAMIRLITDNVTERLLYIAEVIFENILKTPYSYTDLSVNRELAFGAEELVLNYSSMDIPGSVRMPVSGLLAEKLIRDHDPAIKSDEFPKLYPLADNGYDLDFDVFSAAFYLITEYEKYGKQIFDRHGRYQENQYFSFKNGLYKEPLVNIYAEHLWEKLSDKYSHLKRQQRKFDYEITIDVDQPWAFLHKGFRGYAGFLKDIFTINFRNFAKRYQSLKTAKDPFDCYEWLYKVCPAGKTRFFFLVSGRSKYDGKHSAHNQYYADLIRETNKEGISCGLHPSYNTYLSAGDIRNEKDLLSGILGEEVITSRQHYLRYRLPQTNRALIEAGIQHDYTTAMVSGIGFRNGIANDFNWFDLEKNEKTALILHPTMAMDVSLRNYLGYDAEYAFNRLLDVVEKTMKVGGRFVIIWHNSNLGQLNGWNDWKGTFSELLKYLDSKAK